VRWAAEFGVIVELGVVGGDEVVNVSGAVVAAQVAGGAPHGEGCGPGFLPSGAVRLCFRPGVAWSSHVGGESAMPLGVSGG
jgi:hypothetical protein